MAGSGRGPLVYAVACWKVDGRNQCIEMEEAKDERRRYEEEGDECGERRREEGTCYLLPKRVDH